MKLLVYGSLNIDHVYRVRNIVKPGETIAVQEYYKNPGGKGLNLSTAIAKAGSEVYHAGLVGQDGDFLIETLNNYGVNCTLIDKTGGVSGQAIIQVSDDGENSILVNGGSNQEQQRETVDKVLAQFVRGDILVLQNEINLLSYIIDEAYNKGMVIALNPSPFNSIINELDLSKITYLVLNRIEGEELTEKNSPEDIIRSLKQKYPSIKVVLTLGSQGVIYGDTTEQIKVDAYKTDVIDTTAAGDTFLGYFLSRISEGDSLEDALKTASKAASITVSRPGASKSIPFFREL